MEMMPEASDNGSQPYSRAFGYGEMAGKELPPKNIACPWVGDMFSSCPLHSSKVVFVWCRSSQPFRNTQGRFCMAGYHCLMPTAFLPLKTNLLTFHLRILYKRRIFSKYLSIFVAEILLPMLQKRR